MKPAAGTLAGSPAEAAGPAPEGSRLSSDRPREEAEPAHHFKYRLRTADALLIVVVCLPWLSSLSAHYAGVPEDATGFIQYDQPYYVANGRAIFERGNGVTHPNPYDPDPGAPSIYFHWLTWLLGFVVKSTACDPGTCYALLGVLTLPCLGWLTWQLIGERLAAEPTTTNAVPPPRRLHGLLYVLAMWGGGLLSVAGLLSFPFTDLSLSDAALRFDPSGGLWFLNWGRNTLLTSEAVYHCLAAGSWLCVLRRHNLPAIALSALLAATHPWSGLELSLTLTAWFSLEAIRLRTRQSGIAMISALLVLLTLLGYYRLWLPSHDSHASLQATWALNWSMPTTTAVLAYSPVTILALLQLWRGNGVIPGHSDRFLFIAAAVALGLTLHDRILSHGIQPIHFSRGYVWMPLFLLGIPKLADVIRGMLNSSHGGRHGFRVPAGAWCGLFLVIGCADNLVFSVIHGQRQYAEEFGFYLTAADRSLLQALHTRVPGEVIICESVELSYLMPVYANVRPWLGHKYNTPQFAARRAQLSAVFPAQQVEISALPTEANVLVCRRSRNTGELSGSGAWTLIDIRNPEWLLWVKGQKTSPIESNIP